MQCPIFARSPASNFLEKTINHLYPTNQPTNNQPWISNQGGVYFSIHGPWPMVQPWSMANAMVHRLSMIHDPYSTFYPWPMVHPVLHGPWSMVHGPSMVYGLLMAQGPLYLHGPCPCLVHGIHGTQGHKAPHQVIKTTKLAMAMANMAMANGHGQDHSLLVWWHCWRPHLSGFR